MKKLIIIAAAVAAMTAGGAVALRTIVSQSDPIFEADVEALTRIENPIHLCKDYCYDANSWVCVLVTIYGYDINCVDMDYNGK